MSIMVFQNFVINSINQEVFGQSNNTEYQSYTLHANVLNVDFFVFCDCLELPVPSYCKTIYLLVTCFNKLPLHSRSISKMILFLQHLRYELQTFY